MRKKLLCESSYFSNMPDRENKIIYLANVRLPTEKAHGIQIAKMCEALARQGIVVELIVPDRLNPIRNNFFGYYGIKKNFVLNKLPCIDLISRTVWLGSVAYWVEALSFAWSVKRHLKSYSGLIYTRELSSVAFLSSRYKVVYEAHNLPKRHGWFFRRLLKKLALLVTITNSLRNDFIALGFHENRVLTAPDAVDLRMFSVSDSKIDCRQRLNLPLDKKIILYTGHFYDWKGAGTVLTAAKLSPDCLVVFVGGTDADIVGFKRKARDQNVKNVLIVGHRPVGEIPTYLCAADVLVLPNSAKPKISARYTSPLKLFEYMASRRPIVASNLPSLREILNEEIATFFEPDNPQLLAERIKLVFDDPVTATQKVERAYLKVQDYTWEKRGAQVMKFIANC